MDSRAKEQASKAEKLQEVARQIKQQKEMENTPGYRRRPLYGMGK